MCSSTHELQSSVKYFTRIFLYSFTDHRSVNSETPFSAWIALTVASQSCALRPWTLRNTGSGQWARVWRRRYRDDELRRRLVTDPHSPSEYRTNGIVSNMPEFYDAFDVHQGDGMYRPPEERVAIW